MKPEMHLHPQSETVYTLFPTDDVVQGLDYSRTKTLKSSSDTSKQVCVGGSNNITIIHCSYGTHSFLHME